MIITAAPAHQLNLMKYFKFLFACGRSEKFTADNVLDAIEKYKPLSLFERLTYRHVVMPQLREALASKGAKFDSIVADRPEWGPGRVDTFNPYKVLVFNLDMKGDKSIGTARFMSIWNQAEQQGIWHHWDGNNDLLDERNFSAAIGAGVVLDPPSFDFAGLERIKQWLMYHPAPRYPFPIDMALAGTGKPIYEKLCAVLPRAGGRALWLGDAARQDRHRSRARLAFDKHGRSHEHDRRRASPGLPPFRATGGYANIRWRASGCARPTCTTARCRRSTTC